MALTAKFLACGLVLFALSSVQSFVPAVSGQREAPHHDAGFAAAVAPAEEMKTVESTSSMTMMPLALGLTLGLALALPQRALAASSGNQDFGTWLERVLTQEALGAFGIAGLSWNVFYLLFGLSGAAIFAFAAVVSFILPPAKYGADVTQRRST